MTEHLPECMTSVVRMNYDCICPELRACEQRVARTREGNGELWLDGYGTGWQDGHTFALDAARKAVSAVPLTGGWTTPDGVIEEIDKAKTIAAIDALRKEN